MSRKQVLNSLKTDNPAGKSLTVLSEEELIRTQGGGDVQSETTPTFSAGVTFGVGMSKLFECGDWL